MLLAQNQIKLAFAQAQKEVDDLLNVLKRASRLHDLAESRLGRSRESRSRLRKQPQRKKPLCNTLRHSVERLMMKIALSWQELAETHIINTKRS